MFARVFAVDLCRGISGLESLERMMGETMLSVLWDF